jgi:4a-hydroxytetrahydrobiopterin dehydratase
VSPAEQKPEPFPVGTAPLSKEEAEKLAKEIPQWTLKEREIEREFKFKDFREAVHFVNKVSAIAEEEDHHPDIHILYNKVRLVLSTHKIGGLSKKDFSLAAKIDGLTGDGA